MPKKQNIIIQQPELQIAENIIEIKPKGKRGKKQVAEEKEEAQEIVVVANANWKQGFEALLKIEKPQDDLDCQVVLPPNARCDYTKVKDNSLLYRPARIVVLKKYDGTSKVRNQDLYKDDKDSDWDLGSNLVAKQCWTADQYTKIEKVSQSVLAFKLKEEVGDCICKVEFTKTPDIAEMSRLIREGSQIIENAPVSDAEKVKMFKKLYERSQKGEYRIMRGYIVRSEDLEMEQNETGMIKFLDADILAKGEMAERLINTRNIVSLTFRLTKYVLK
jgi:hypothetical protein